MDRKLAAQAALTLAADADTAHVVGALRRAGVEPVLLKGPAVAHLLQVGQALRPYCDIDLMVAPDDVVRAEATLRQLGYEPGLPPLPPDPPTHATSWSHPTRRPVDLHQRLHFVDAPAERTWKAVRHNAAPIDVGGTPVLAPAAAVQAMHLALHAAASAHVVGRTLSELERGLAKLSAEVWKDASAVAAELGAADAFHGGLTLCPAGARLAEQLGLSATECQTMEFWRATDARTEPWTIELLVRQPSLRAALGALARRCFPPAHYVRPVLGRPGRLWLALGYVVRLREAVRFAVRFPRSLVAWARVSRATKRAAPKERRG